MAEIEISARQLRYRSDERWTLDQVELNVGEQEVVVLEGVSGSGKTSILKFMIGDPDIMSSAGGRLRFKYQGRECGAEELRRRQLFTFVAIDHPFLNWCSVRESICRLASLAGRKVDAAAIDRSPLLSALRLDPALADAAPFRLSYGQRRRFALLAALLLEPPILLIDEVFSGLDSDMRRATAQLLVDYAANNSAAVVVTSHEAGELGALSSQIHKVVLKDELPGQHRSVLTPVNA